MFDSIRKEQVHESNFVGRVKVLKMDLILSEFAVKYRFSNRRTSELFFQSLNNYCHQFVKGKRFAQIINSRICTPGAGILGIP
jgi:hypothetical protein